METNIEEMDIKDLKLPVRALNALKGVGIKTIKQLIAIDDEDKLKAIRRLGKVSENNVIEEVHARGLRFAFEKKREEEENTKEGESISSLNLTKHPCNALKRAGFDTIEKLINIEDIETLIRIKEFGEKSREEVIDAVHRRGLRFVFEEKETQQDERLIAAIESVKEAYATLNRAEQEYKHLRKEQSEMSESLDEVEK